MNPEELGRLLSLISHEVRAPLGVMRGYLRLLEQQGSELSDQHRHAVTAALKAGERAADLLSQLSALARLQRGEGLTTRRPTPLEPLLRSAVHEVAMPPEPIVTVHVDDCPPWTITADEELLRIAIAGLTSAVVRAQAADARVFLRAREARRAGQDGITLTIAPNDAICDVESALPFDIMRGGLGLDLPIAAFIIAAHGGVVFESREHDRFAGIVMWVPWS